MVSTLINTMLRDTCVKAYREAYNKQGWLWQPDETTQKYEDKLNEISTLIKVAICLTSTQRT